MPPAAELTPIVVGVDGSVPSLPALRWAVALAPLFNSSFRAVSSWQSPIAFGTFTPVVLDVMSLDPTGTGRQRWSNRWKAALNAFEVTFDGRLSAGKK
ncbi:universal stress protein [Pseudarthrobacter sp. RMG13]|uniref:Universal stress protein n=1 Tax=Pseudarthrobacter humi TaxID=2952523 RepID=A0ABT1LJ92_9MICC|nr:universal stress protein [Pseudarthrobacter humi]MCP8998500.1 universal stress protein [Pseudarthrobacter humi]